MDDRKELVDMNEKKLARAIEKKAEELNALLQKAADLDIRVDWQRMADDTITGHHPCDLVMIQQIFKTKTL